MFRYIHALGNHEVILYEVLRTSNKGKPHFQLKEVTVWDPDVTRTGDKTTLQVDIAKVLKNGKSESVNVRMALNTIPTETKYLMFKAYVET